MTKLQISWYTTSKICQFFKSIPRFKARLTILSITENAFNIWFTTKKRTINRALRHLNPGAIGDIIIMYLYT